MLFCNFYLFNYHSSFFKVARDLSTDSHILVLWQLITTWDQSKTIRIDNGVNFVGANRKAKNIASGFGKISYTLINQAQVSKTWFYHQLHEWKNLGVYCESYEKVFDLYYKEQTCDLWNISGLVNMKLHSPNQQQSTVAHLKQISDDINYFNILNHFILEKQP